MSNRSRIANLSTTKLALLARQTYDQVEDILKAEPIAVIGIGCRFPGGADTPLAFWQMMVDKVCAMSEVPADRWNIDDYYAADFAAPGKMNSRLAGFLDHIDQFDPAFFDIPKREAAQMDPQQRIALEVAYEALENAGINHANIRGSQAGVYLSSYHNDYAHLIYANLPGIDLRTLTGTQHSVTSNRISYLLDLHGPSVTLDTACSSSLVALHMACQSLRNRETDLCLAGGVNTIVTPGLNVALSKVGFTSPSGHCYTFDARADGFVRGEGCGVVVLKRLSDAIPAGDRILAVIRASAVNQDGRSTVLTAPNGQAQQAVINQAIQSAGLTPDQIGLFEAHGTGTHLGDPLEVEALAQVVGPRRGPDHFCYLTSVKANIGHLEAGAGIAGVIKVILSLQHEAIPAHPTFERLNPNISLDNTPFVIPTELTPWPRGEKPRYAGVSSYGVGGTNAHVVLGEPPLLNSETPKPAPARSWLLPLSARSPTALVARVESLQAYLQNPDRAADIADIGYTASLRRTHFEHRLGVVGNSLEQISKKLQALLQDRARLEDAARSETPEQPPRLAFVFSGQGTQWPRMAANLIEQEPVFKETIERCDAALRPLAGWSILEKLTAVENESELDQTRIAQPAIFAVQMALAALWRSWGVTPDAVVGHSLGEIAAACTAGILTLEEAVHLVYHRGRLMQQATGSGKMVSVDLAWEEVERIIAPYTSELAIGAINAPNATVISGSIAAVDAVVTLLQARGVGVHPLRVNYAFHSPQMEPYARELSALLQDWHGKPEQISFISTVAGGKLSGAGMDGAYWGRNIRQPVRFADAVRGLVADGVTVFLEVSPHPALSAMIEQTVRAADPQTTIRSIPSLKRVQPELDTLLDGLGKLYQAGTPIDWQVFYPNRGSVVELPPYPWQHRRYWLEETPAAVKPTARPAGEHPLLGSPLRSPAIQGTLYQNQLSAADPAFLGDHRVFGRPVVPAAALLEMGLSAASLETEGPHALEDFFFADALLLPENQPRPIQVHLSPLTGEERTLQVYAQSENKEWILCTSGVIRQSLPGQIPAGEDLAAVQAACAEKIQGSDWYARVNQHGEQSGVTFGERFQGIQQVWRKEWEALAELRLKDTPAAEPYRFHPALLDAALQPITAALPAAQAASCYLPFNLGRLRVFAPVAEHCWSHVTLAAGAPGGADTLTCQVRLLDDRGQVLVEIADLVLKRTTRAALRRAFLRHLPAETGPAEDGPTDISDCFYQLTWEPAPLAAAVPPRLAGTCVLFADQGGGVNSVGAQLAARIRAAGGGCLTVLPAAAYSAPRDGIAAINPARAEDYQRLWRDLDGAGAPLHVIHLWSLDLPALEESRSLGAHVLGLRSALYLTQAILSATQHQNPRLTLVTRGSQAVDRALPAPEQSPLWGMANALILENPDIPCACLDLDPLASPAGQAEAVLGEIALAFDPAQSEDRVAWREGKRLALRLNAVSPSEPRPPQQPERLAVGQIGNLDSLSLQAVKREKPGPGQVEIRVQAAGLNFRDVLKAMGRYPGETGASPRLGDECAGVISAVGSGVAHLRVGDPVIALAAGAFSTYVIASAGLVIPRPAALSPQEAAAIPIATLTAWYTLYHLAHLHSGQSVLIHAAAGGVGLAAVQLAQRVGAEIFATAGSAEKRDFLRTLGVQHVLDSRSLEFTAQIQTITGGRGVDVVLNSLAGEFISKSFTLLAPNGCFLEIGKTGILTVEEAARTRPDVAYHPVFLGEIFEQDPALIRAMLNEILAAGQAGELPPLPRREFPISAAAEAFRFMARARQIGKIVLTLPELTNDRLDSAFPLFRADSTYLVTGGLGGIGKVITRWMVENGARNLALVSRKGAGHPDAQSALAALAGLGAQVSVFQANAASLAELTRVFDQVRAAMPPLRGVIHAAGLVEDGVILQQDWGRFDRVLAAKADGAWNLHQLTRRLSLDHFVLFSSIAAPLGSSGQSNYAAANAFLAALAAARAAEGLPAVCIDWGVWLETGMTAQLTHRDQENLSRRGLKAMSPAEGVRALDLALRFAPSEVLVLPVDWPLYLGDPARSRRFYAAVQAVAVKPTAPNATGKPADSPRSGLLPQLEQTPSGQRRGALIAHIHREVIRLVGLDSDTAIDPARALNSYGLDSLMAVEMRNALSAALAKSLPATLLFDYPTSQALADYLLKTIPGLQPEPTAAAEPTPAGAALAEMSDAEAEAELLAELARINEGKPGD